MTRPEWQQRVLEEAAQLAARLEKLQTFLVAGMPGCADREARELLLDQHAAMVRYLEVLARRIAAFPKVES